MIGSNTYALPSSQPSANEPSYQASSPGIEDLPTFAGHQVEVVPNGAIKIDGLTATEGQQTTIDGKPISVGFFNVFVGTDSCTRPLVTNPIISYGNVPKGSNAVSIPTLPTDMAQALAELDTHPGFQATIAGTPVSLASSVIVIGTSMYALPLPTNAAISYGSNGAIMFYGKTLIPGMQITVSGTLVSLGKTIVAVDNKTYGLQSPTHPAASLVSNYAVVLDEATLTRAAQMTISGNAISLASNDALILNNSITLNPGAQTTISGNTVSVDSDFIVIAGNTYAVSTKPRDAAAATTTTTPDLGAVIASMYGYEPSSAPSSASVDPNGSSTLMVAAVTGMAACKAGAGEGKGVMMRLALLILVGTRVLGL